MQDKFKSRNYSCFYILITLLLIMSVKEKSEISETPGGVYSLFKNFIKFDK